MRPKEARDEVRDRTAQRSRGRVSPPASRHSLCKGPEAGRTSGGTGRREEVGVGKGRKKEVGGHFWVKYQGHGPGSYIYTKTEQSYAPSPWLPSALQPSIHVHIPEISE